MPVRKLALLTCLSLCATARGSSVALEVGASGAQATDFSPRTGSGSARVLGDFDASDAFAFHVDLGLTRNQAEDPPPGVRVGSSGGTVLSVALGSDWMPTPRFDLGLEVNASPSAVEVAGTELFPSGTGQSPATGVVRSDTKSFGGLLAVSVNTGDDHDVDAAFDGSAAVTRFLSNQQLSNAAGQTIPPRYCDTNPCSEATRQFLERFGGLLGPHTTNFTETRLGAGVLLTVLRDTDAQLSGAYYVYSTDPNQTGFFPLTQGGRLNADFGQAVPLSPLQFTVRPTLAHRFGPLSLSAYYEYGSFIDGLGHVNGVGLRAQVRIDRHWRLYVRFDGERNVDPDGNTSPAGSLIGGVRYAF